MPACDHGFPLRRTVSHSCQSRYDWSWCKISYASDPSVWICRTEPLTLQIRVSLYVLALSSPILTYAFGSAELSNAIEPSLDVTGLALFLTTVIATARQSPGLFHALCVFHLLSLVGLSIRPRGRYPTGVVSVLTFLSFFVLAAAGLLSYLIYVFATTPMFGDQPECNSQIVYAIFGIKIPATNAVLRWVFVGILASLLVLVVTWLVVIPIMGYCVVFDALLSRPHFIQHAETDGTEEKRKGPLCQVISQVVGSVYFIIMLELMMQRSTLASGVGSWTFGQVLAMMMLVGPLIELVSILLGKVDAGSAGSAP